jgi:hypothetical protein
LALHALWIFPLAGYASIENAVNEFSSEASKRGATLINIEETSSFTYWFIVPPFSFFIHPVNATISGNVEGATGKVRNELNGVEFSGVTIVEEIKGE